MRLPAQFPKDISEVWQCFEMVSVATPAGPRGEKNFILCKFWVVKNF